MPKFMKFSDSQSKSKEGTAARRKLMHEVWRFLLHSLGLTADNQCILEVSGKKYMPILTFFSMDHPEAQATSGIKDGNTDHPCRFCTVHKTQMSRLRPYSEEEKQDIPLRRNVVSSQQQNFSEQPEISPLCSDPLIQYFHEGRGAGWILPPCLMHTLGQGLCCYCSDHVQFFVRNHGFPSDKKKKKVHVDGSNNIDIVWEDSPDVTFYESEEFEANDLDENGDVIMGGPNDLEEANEQDNQNIMEEPDNHHSEQDDEIYNEPNPDTEQSIEANTDPESDDDVQQPVDSDSETEDPVEVDVRPKKKRCKNSRSKNNKKKQEKEQKPKRCFGFTRMDQVGFV